MRGLSGSSGEIGGSELLDGFLRLGCSGTLILRQAAGLRLLLLDGGQVRRANDVGLFGPLDDPALDFHFAPHPAGELPQLPSGFPGSAVSAMRALPVFGTARGIEPGVADLRALVGRLRDEGFSGSLTLHAGPEAALVLFHQGAMNAAFYERDGYVWERADALRSVYRYSLELGKPPLELRPLPNAMVRGLMGLALERHAGAVEPNSFVGVSAGEAGYSYYCDGQPYLQVSAELLGTSRRFSAPGSLPALLLPDEPPGWERRRYGLTLRGRDALNPMTELSMEFGDSFGSTGRRVLKALQQGHTLEETAARLELDLQALKPWLERLEGEGFIRPRG